MKPKRMKQQPAQKNKQLWIIIPAHNEKNNIGRVVQDCKNYTDNIIVVDDGSTDNTYTIAKELGIIVLRHIVNLGKGAALKTGCDFAYSKKAEIMIAMDADGQHNPKMIPVFLEKLKKYDIVFGIRELNRRMPFILRFGNNFINFIIDMLFHVNLKDTQSGYRAFHGRHYKKIRWLAPDYSMESEMIANVGRHKLKYTQVPIKTIYNDKYKGTTIVDGIKIVYNIIKWRISKW